jgi:hypothetical protein
MVNIELKKGTGLKLLFCAAILMLLLWSCGKNPLKVDLSGITEEVSIVRYDEELFALGSDPAMEDLIRLRNKYPQFTDLYTHLVLKVGDVTDTSGWFMMREFLSDTTTRSVKKMTEKEFADLEPLKKELIKAFKHYRYYFPGKPLPVVYFTLSGFNESVFTADSLVGISLDKYLGRECVWYDMLDLPLYKQRKMIPEMIPAEVMYTWGMTEFPIGGEATTLLDYMVYEGKLLYFTHAMLPRTADTLLTGFTRKQAEWCQRNEAPMWNYLVEHQMLFSTRQMDIVRYTSDGPTTNGFPPASPARTGAWLGLQIVKAYLKKNPDITLAQLMGNRNYREILNAAAYAPQ